MADKLLPIKLPPGFRDTGTVYESKGRWYTGNFVRFFNGTIQPIGGWAARSLTGATISGVPRAMISYLRQVGSAASEVLVIGTTRGLYAIVGTVKYDITPAAISSTVSTRTWQFDVFGTVLVAVDRQTANAPGRAYHWAGDVSGPTVAAANPYFDNSAGPQNTWSLVVTPERHLLALGGPYNNLGVLLLTGIPNPRVVQWADQETGISLDADWEPTATNTAGAQELATNGQVMTGARSRGGTLIWTTVDLWLCTYIGGELIHRFDKVGDGCGIISGNAKIVNDTAAFWMGQNGFYAYDGFVKPIPCDVQDYVFNSLNRSYDYLIWALENPTYGEVTWFYPHAAQTEITRYVTYNYRENHWTYGSLERTCGISMQPGTHVYPVMCNAAGSVFNHETGSARNSEGTPSLESGPIELGDGDNLMQVQSVLPDDDTVGDVNLTLYGTNAPDTAETTYGPYTLTARTTFRAKARQFRIKLTEAVATAWRVGTIRLGVVQSSRR